MKVEMSWLEMGGAGWSWVEMGGAGWGWVELDAWFSNALLKVVRSSSHSFKCILRELRRFSNL